MARNYNAWDVAAIVVFFVLLPLIIPMAILFLIVGGILMPLVDRGKIAGDRDR